MTLRNLVEDVGKGVDVVGVAAIVVGSIAAAVFTLRSSPRVNLSPPTLPR